MNDLEEKIRTLTKEKGVKMEAIYSFIGMSNAGFYKMLRNNTMKVETLGKIADVLDVPMSVFFGNMDSRSRDYEKEISYLKNEIDHLKELNASYKKLIKILEDDERGERNDISSVIYWLKETLKDSTFQNLSDEQKELVMDYFRINLELIGEKMETIFEKYGLRRGKKGEDFLKKKLADAVSDIIKEKKIIDGF